MMSDLVIIGAGPAGMAAAATAAECGLGVTLLDEQPRPGGQIYRDVDRASDRRAQILGADYLAGRDLTAGLSHPGITHVAGATVWSVEPSGRVLYARDGTAASVEGQRVILATGALERPMPLPGWILPGVMTAGAAQILLKQGGIVPERAVLVGCGPLLYLIAAQLVRACTPPLALVETQHISDLRRGLPHIGGALRGWRYLAKGAAMLREIRAARIPRHTAATAIAIEGDGRVERLRFTAGGKQHVIDCATVLLHHGVVPNVQASRALGLAHDWDAEQHCFRPQADDWGESSVAGVFVAGDGAGIGGAKVAALRGRLAALQAAHQLGRMTPAERERRAAPLRRAMDAEMAIRPFLDAAYPPHAAAIAPDDATVICRCEEVTAGDIRRQARLGCLGPNQAKAFVRAGMGPCQGRYCGLTVTALLAASNGETEAATGYYRIRPPIKPVTLGELAGMADTGSPTEE